MLSPQQKVTAPELFSQPRPCCDPAWMPSCAGRTHCGRGEGGSEAADPTDTPWGMPSLHGSSASLPPPGTAQGQDAGRTGEET